MTFDLEKNRAAIDSAINSLLCEGWDNEASTVRRLVAEIERLRVSLIDLHAEYINTLEKNPECSAWDLDEQSEADQRRLRKNAAHITSTEEPLIYLQVDQQTIQIEELKDQLKEADQYRRSSLNHVMQIANQRDEAEARIKELESSLDEAEALTKKNAELMNSYLTRIAELEDALVEGLTNFLHYRASCYDPARRCPYAKECDDCSTWDACGHVEKFRSEARQRLQADGKIGPGTVAPPCWKITEERKETLRRALEEYKIFPNDQAVLRAMLTEGE